MRTQKFTIKTFILLLILVGLGAYAGFQYYWQPRSKLTPKEQRAYARFQRRQRLLRNPQTAKDIVALSNAILSTGYAHVPKEPKSAVWQRSQQKWASADLHKAKYAYIVLPLEQNMRFYDRVTRLMAARWVARTLALTTGKTVMSPELALRALGKRTFIFNNKQVTALANRVGAQVIHIFLTYDLNPSVRINRSGWTHPGRMHIYAALTTANGQILKAFKLPLIDNGSKAFGSLFAAMAPTVVSHLMGTVAHATQPAVILSQTIAPLPKHIDQMPETANSPLSNAAYLQLIAMLTPRNRRYDRRRLMGRSLLALKGVSPTSRYYDVLTARALFYLYRRPAALTYLTNAKTPAAKALRAYLNGNYPELTALVPKIKDPVLRIMALLDLKYLGYDYDKSHIGSGIALPVPSPQWLTLIADAGHDGDIWYAPNNIPFFGDLSGLFPRFDKQLLNGVNGLTASGSYNPDGPNFDTFQTIFDRAFSAAGDGCCDRYGARLQRADIWALYHDLAVANLLRQLDRDDDVYGDYDDAKSLGAELAPWLMGNPWYMETYADALNSYAKKLSGSQKTYALTKAQRLAKDTVRAAGEVDIDTSYSQWLYQHIYPEVPRTGNSSAYIESCNWRRCDLPSSLEVDASNGDPIALPYENSNFGLVKAAAKEKSLSDAEMETLLNTRFDGAPAKTAFVADRLIKSGQKDKAIAMLKAAIAKRSENWPVYKMLGTILIDKGEYAAASKTFMKFPDFGHTPEGQEVETSNRAYYAGRKLYWIGRYKEAMPLYKVAANLDTNADTQYLAIKYHAFTVNDYQAVLKIAYVQAQHYGDAGAYRDYLTVMHLVGLHKRAEAGFEEVYARIPSMVLWNSMFIGQRMEKLSLKSMALWVKNYLASLNATAVASAADIKRFAVGYLINQAATDRKLSLTDIKAIDNVDKTTQPGIFGPQNRLAKELGLHDQHDALQCSPVLPKCATLMRAENPYARDGREGFLYAYTLLQEKKYTKSIAAFISYNKYDPMLFQGEVAPTLPYFAMALAAGHRASALSALASLLGEPRYNKASNTYFDELTRAVIEAGLGHSDKSLLALVAAHRHISLRYGLPTDGWYQLINETQWLYHATGNARFRKKAVEWAREHEVIQPQDGWAYAFEARYARRRSARIRAAAFAEYLDPRSYWLSQVPASIRRRARRWWPKHDPFTLTPNQQHQTQHKISF